MLEEQREQFRSSLPAHLDELWTRFRGRIAVVLSGGGARGAYEAGVLLAFQDARLPTHILTATSIGAINAASYAAHADGYVGNAESLVRSWSEVTPPAVGIDWSRYMLILTGLVALTAGFGNFIARLFHDAGIYLHMHDPLLTWFLLGVAGLSVVLLHDQISYVFYVLMRIVHRYKWKPDKRKATLSVVANVVVWGFVGLFLRSTHLHVLETRILEFTPRAVLVIVIVCLIVTCVWLLFRSPISSLNLKLLQLPLRPGLFPNYERTRFLRDRIDVERLRRSRIRVVMTATDLRSGSERLFVNQPVEEIEKDPHVDASFLGEKQVEQAADLMKAVIASSAFPMAYEPVEIRGRLCSDGGLVAKQPVIPAIRLGADAIFLVTVDAADEKVGAIKTFMDVGMRAFDILMSRNVQADLAYLHNVNRICETCAADVGALPEQIQLEIANRTYRFVKTFTVRPARRLSAALLDFDGAVTRPAISQGYMDGTQAVRDFIDYATKAPVVETRKIVRLRAEELRGAKVGR